MAGSLSQMSSRYGTWTQTQVTPSSASRTAIAPALDRVREELGALPTDMLIDEPIIKSMGFALAVAVLFDAFVVRMAIVPAVMTLLGSLMMLLPVWRNDVHLDLQLLVATLLLMVVAALAVTLAARGVRTRDAAARVPARVSLAAERGLGFDYAYRLLVATPVVALARGVSWFDREVLDAWVRGAGAGSRLAGRAGELLTPRRATPALALVLGGVLVLAALGVVSR